MSSSGPSFRRWARGLKEDVKDGFKGLIRSTAPSRSSTPDLRPGQARVEGPSDANVVHVSPPATTTPDGSSLLVAPVAQQPQLVTDVSLPEGSASLVDAAQSCHDFILDGPDPILQNAPGAAFHDETAGSQRPALAMHTTHLPPANEPIEASSTVKDALKVSLNFTQTFLKRLPEIVDGNPVKMALSLAKMIVEIKEAVKDNMDAVERRIASTGAQLEIVADTRISRWGPSDPEKPWLDRFKQILAEELMTLSRLGDEWLIRKIADHENEKSQIAATLERVNDARMQFELYTNIRILNTVKSMERAIGRSFLNELKPSRMADHKYYLEGKQREALRREACTPGTRVRILGDVKKWANNPESEDIFWMFGPAGSGKTTIAFTIARRFEATFDADDTITLGGNFLCSRQFEETRLKTCIIRTLVYQLARKCEGFAEALNRVENFDSIDQDVGTQLRDLLIIPWKQYRSTRGSDSSSSDRFLFLIDAVDEIEQQGGSEFLRDLLTVIHDNHLPGLKFFVTSRSDPEIVSRVEGFERKQLVRLQDVEEEEAEKDIGTYLEANLPQLKGAAEMNLIQKFVGGLFIVAATIVRHLTLKKRTRPSEQKVLIQRLFCPETRRTASTNPTHLLDSLYTQILTEAFDQFPEEFFAEKLGILHTCLCTVERTPTFVVAKLLELEDPDGSTDSTNPADDVVSSLHAVLYTDGNHVVLSYHKSFADFIFDKTRSGDFACDQPSRHRLLTERCFHIMNASLKFNIANIPLSFVLDSENPDLQNEVQRNISPDLSYSCRSWSRHLTLTQPPFPIVSILSDFLQLRVLFWIEVMNLLNAATRCDPDLCQASEWVEKHEDNVLLAQQLREAGSFALHFSTSPASRSTPHLYISSLTTWPRHLDLTPIWTQHFPRIPNFRTRGSQNSVSLVNINVGSEVYGVAVSSDGKYIASGSWDSLARVWDARNGNLVKALEGHSGGVTSVAFSRDGGHIVSGSNDETVRVWNTTTWEEKVLQGRTSTVESVAFSSDFRWIVSGSHDGSVRLWSTTTGSEPMVLQGHTETVYSVAFSPDGAQVVSGSADDTVRLWDAKLGKQLMLLEGHTDEVTSVAFSSDGAWIVSGADDESVRIWDTAMGKEVKVLRGHSSLVYSVAISEDGRRVASASGDRTVRLWDAATGEVVKVLRGHTSSVFSVAFSSDGRRVISGSPDGTIRVWDTMAGEVDQQMKQDVTGVIFSVAFSESGTRIISGLADNSVRVWDGMTGEQLGMLEGHTGAVNSVAFSTDGTRIVSGSDDKSVRVWCTATGEELLLLQGHTGVVFSVAFSSDGASIVSASRDTTVRIWDAVKGGGQRVLTGHTGDVLSVAFSSDGARIASGSADGTVRIWDSVGGNQLQILEGHTYYVLSVAFLPDGTHVVSGSADRSIRIWDTLTGQVRNILQGHTNWVRSVAPSGNGTRVVSGSDDTTVRVWDTTTGEELLTLKGHSGWVYSVAFSRDGTRIVSGSEDSTLRVWDLSLAFSSEVIEGEATGWLLESPGRYLMHVPAEYRLPCVLLISGDGGQKPSGSYVTFSSDAIGDQWQNCYAPLT
ncbi:WD40 repeat-like protein [Coprinellus micaceus]|uniref:WD40 repeat-like protein n=1 Tax=Coprinellus micaceus TaxID=71717 RepID=A0A4Y7T9T7_COPMI|nr:WD40 repeat-like protein [Coprinellus micaceus]